MTVQPDSFAIGANFLATSDPAEKKAKLTEEKLKFSFLEELRVKEEKLLRATPTFRKV